MAPVDSHLERRREGIGMWNPFTRRETSVLEPKAEREPIQTISPNAQTNIADIRVTGKTAIATVTATVISQDVGVERLAELLVDLEETGSLHIILDIQNVEYMDSACLGCLVDSLNRMSARGGKIALVNPAYRVNYLFKLTRLDRVFRICSDVPTALHALEMPVE
jgi:anti-sigma B factor antagonist